MADAACTGSPASASPAGRQSRQRANADAEGYRSPPPFYFRSLPPFYFPATFLLLPPFYFPFSYPCGGGPFDGGRQSGGAYRGSDSSPVASACRKSSITDSI